jgi:quinol monooxygenase YgiN
MAHMLGPKHFATPLHYHGGTVSSQYSETSSLIKMVQIPENDLYDPPQRGPFKLVVHIVAKSSEASDKLFTIISSIADRANSDVEPDTISYAAFRSVDDQKTILVLEEYQDAAALLGTHMDGDGFKTLLENTDLAESISARFYDVQ